VWQLTKEAYGLTDVPDSEIRLRKDIVHISFNGHP
jgi:hypothetical protein